MSVEVTTIAAIATPPGQGGVGIIRVSGPMVKTIMTEIVGRVLPARYAYYGNFHGHDEKQCLDQGIALYFPGPHSLTGEDVLELQGHGGMIVLDKLLQHVLSLGAKLAAPGEFLKRAYLNDKIDLAQAEAIADLIAASSEQAMQSALSSLQGHFSETVDTLYEQLMALRVYVEAAIDFPDEEIDFLSHGKVAEKLSGIIEALQSVKRAAKQGSILREGMKVVLMGKPNVGKSSLLNALAGTNRAIVTDIAGTTRDILQEQIHIDGMPLQIYDTAGLRLTEDVVEQAGIQRAIEQIKTADRLLFLTDEQMDTIDIEAIWPKALDFEVPKDKLTLIRNKIDLGNQPAGEVAVATQPTFNLSVKSNEGLSALLEHLKDVMGYVEGEGTFMARRRHLEALEQTLHHLYVGQEQLQLTQSGELLAEDLRYAQRALGQITGKDSVDDLLDNIFSSFCIGK